MSQGAIRSARNRTTFPFSPTTPTSPEGVENGRIVVVIVPLA
jgi:hypothetical protein